MFRLFRIHNFLFVIQNHHLYVCLLSSGTTVESRISYNEWNHLAITWNSSSCVLTVFVMGRLTTTTLVNSHCNVHLNGDASITIGDPENKGERHDTFVNNDDACERPN